MEDNTNNVEIKDLQRLLSHKIGPDYSIVDYSTKNLTALGDNYGSLMLSLTVNLRHCQSGEEKTLDLVSKMAPRNPIFFAVFQIPVTFPKESAMYTVIAEEYKRHQVERSVPELLRSDPFCQCFGSRRNLESPSEGVADLDAVLLLENLKMKGFVCGDRTKGFNKTDTEFILRHLARFHAVPIAIRYGKPTVFEEKFMPYLKKVNMTLGMDPTMKTEVDDFTMDTVEMIPELKHLVETIRKQMDIGWAFTANTDMNRKSPYNTISHSDFWVNNMMLRYNANGTPDEIKIVDFQIPNFNSAAIDLVFFLMSSVESELVEKDLDHFLEFYFNELNWCLMANGCPMEDFTYESFLAEVNEMASFELQHILMMTKVLLMDSKKLESTNGVAEDVMLNRDLIGPDFYKKFSLIVRTFEKRNWLVKT